MSKDSRWIISHNSSAYLHLEDQGLLSPGRSEFEVNLILAFGILKSYLKQLDFPATVTSGELSELCESRDDVMAIEVALAAMLVTG